jgi:hypothetical protein
LSAGCDLLLICQNVPGVDRNAANLTSVHAALTRRAESDGEFRDLLREAAVRTTGLQVAFALQETSASFASFEALRRSVVRFAEEVASRAARLEAARETLPMGQ